MGVEPLHPSVPFAAMQDGKLYELLALFDALRVGKARERNMATERLLSSVFIASQSYGTRASTALIVREDGSRWMVERSFGPFGGHLGEVEIRI